MYDLLLRIEQAGMAMEPFPLMICGLIAIVLGLFLWLGGMRYSSLVIGLCGGAVGAIAGLALSQWFDIHVALTALIGAGILGLISILIQRIVIIILAIVIFTIIAGTTYVSYHYNSEEIQNKMAQIRQQALNQPTIDTPALENTNTNWAELNLLQQYYREKQVEADPQKQSQTTKATETLKTIWAELRLAASENRTALILWAVVGGIVGLTLGYLVMKLMMALCCSLVGSTGICAGVIAVLLAKNSTVITSLLNRPRVLPTIFASMIIFGLLMQAIVSRKPKKVVESDDNSD